MVRARFVVINSNEPPIDVVRREMAHDPAVYSEPDTFNPSRFLGTQPERDPALYVFGFGRRFVVCS